VSRHASVAVIVTAFDRRQYFTEAVESVLRMGAGNAPVEYLLVRNFEDASVDRRLAEQGVRLILDSSPGVGGTLYCALDHSEAEFLAFVDDDDLVLPHRLQRFHQIRELVPDLAYYHNRFATFSGASSPIANRIAGSLEWQPHGRDSWKVFQAGEDDSFLKFLAQRSQEQNLSSTIVRRSVLEWARPELSKLAAWSDTGALFAGIVSGAPLVFDHEITTLVRRHRTNVSKTLKDTLQRAEALELSSRLIARSRNASVAREYLELRRAREILYNHVLGVPSSSEEILRATRTILQYWKRLHRWRDLGFLELAATALIVPAALPLLRELLIAR